jgi:hypothetical protein
LYDLGDCFLEKGDLRQLQKCDRSKRTSKADLRFAAALRYRPLFHGRLT